MAESYKKEKKAHDDLLKLLKKHFMEDEDDILKDEMEDMEEMKPMSKYMGLRRGKKPGSGSDKDPDMDYEGEEEEYDKEGEDDDYYDEVTEEMEDEDVPKEKRKKLAIIVLSKKAGRKAS